jgi:hypothetical protein
LKRDLPTTLRNWLLCLTASSVLLAAVAYAQLRTLPDSVKQATVGQQQYPLPFIDLGGKRVKLAPGGVIYDQSNRTIVHNALPAGADIAYTIDLNGDIARIYVLTPFEKAQLDNKP